VKVNEKEWHSLLGINWILSYFTHTTHSFLPLVNSSEMSSQNYSMAWTEDESHEDQLFNVGITRKEMEKKISFRLHHILIHLVLGVGLNLADIGGDMYSSVQRYNKQNEGNHTAQNITHQEEGSSWHFPVSVFLLVFPSFVIMSFSLVTYWREEQSKLKLTGWGLLRLACHFPFFLLAPAVRYHLFILI